MTVHRNRYRLAVIVVGVAIVFGIAMLQRNPRTIDVGDDGPGPRRPARFQVAERVPTVPEGFTMRTVRAQVRERRGIYHVTPEFRTAIQGFEATQRPAPKSVRRDPIGVPDSARLDPFGAPEDPAANDAATPAGTGLIASFDSTNFLSNGTIAGVFAIPADPQAAAGPGHVITTTNTTALVHDKNGAVLANAPLAGFFAPLSPVTATFDPRVVWDAHNGRWLILTTEYTDVAGGASSNTSRILLAVSQDANPLGTWELLEINAITAFFNPQLGGTVLHWADFPQVAIDEEAIYITGTMFAFAANGGVFGGVRLWIIPKGEGTGGLYDGGTAFVDQYDPLPSPAIVTDGTPAMVFGTPSSPSFGTYIVNYSGLSNGVDEGLQIVRIDDPLGTPIFTPSVLLLGDIQDTSIGPPFTSPQAGSATDIVTNNSSAVKAVWRQDRLWAAFSVIPPADDPQAGQVEAHWVRVSFAGAPAVVEQGRATGEDIAPGVHTFFPSLAVNEDLDVLFGYAASGPSIFPGAYYALHDADSGPGELGPSQVLMAGVDAYVRTLGTPNNRWGDFSSVSLDPVDDCFWIFNNYAMERGTILDAGNGPEDGQWATRAGKYCPEACKGTPDAVTGVTLSDAAGTTLSWNDQGAGLTYDIVIGLLSLVRDEGAVGAAGCAAAQVPAPTYVDALPAPPAGQARYYLLRARSSCGAGDYGAASDGALRVPTPGCPD